MKKRGVCDSFLNELKPTANETASVRETNKKKLEIKCRQSITLKNCGDNLIMTFRQYAESNDIGQLMISIQAMTGLRMTEVVVRAQFGAPKINHDRTDDVYWSWVTGITKKRGAFEGHERPLLHRRDILESAINRLRNNHFADLQACTDNTTVAARVCKRINRAIRKAWPYPDVKQVTSHFFRSFYVAATFHYFNQTSSIAAWCSDVLCHESLDTSHPYTGLLITGFGSLSFNTERSLQGMARLSI